MLLLQLIRNFCPFQHGMLQGNVLEGVLKRLLSSSSQNITTPSGNSDKQYNENPLGALGELMP